MAEKKLKRNFCLTVSLLALLLGACATTQQPHIESDGAVDGSGGALVLPDKRRGKQGNATTTADKTYDNVWNRIRDGFRLPDLDSPHVDYYVRWYSDRPAYVERLVNRASLYLYYIVEELERHDFPMEIALLPAIESAFHPRAYSRAHAAGLWQFIPATGRRYGLKQNWWYDGRRDVVGATEAAIEYLSFLRDEFNGDWFHALAAYNGGERRVKREISRNRQQGRPTDYQHLRLRRETMRYVPKLLAVKRIVENPERYDLTLKPISNRPYFEVLNVGSQIDLGIVADFAGIPAGRLHKLNPGFRRWATDPSGPHRVLVPVGTKEKVAAKLAALPPENRMRWARHQVRRGDTLSHIASRYGVSVNALQSSNRMRGTLIRTGETLLVPLSSASIASTEPGRRAGQRDSGASSPGATKNDQGKRTQWARYRVRRGDTLSRIARRYGVSVRTLQSSNGMRGTLIRAGQTLLVPQAAASVASSGSGQGSGQAVVHQVERGDTLWGIARHYKVHIKQLLRWNEIASQDILQLGQRIMVYLN